MSYADYKFVINCRNILSDSGISDEGFDVRPRWSDGTPAHTRKLLYVQDRYMLAKDSIPVMTLRKTGFKNAIDEILWIYQKKTSELSELHSHIWDSWDVGDGTIGKAYGYQIGKKARHHKYHSGEDLNGIDHFVDINDWVWMSQTDAVLWDLKNNPGSRSIMTNTYNHEDLSYMGLRPCAYSMHYIVTKNADGQMVLNGKLIQRSQDMLTANNWNVVQYSVLLQMFAQVTGMVPGLFVHEVADMHIYDRHIPIVREMIDRYSDCVHQARRDSTTGEYNVFTKHDMDLIENIPHPNPKFWINPDVHNFYAFTTDDFKLIDYEYEPFDHKIEVAV